jgi:glycerophosphoryl diester phosphodiesterase
MWIIGHRGASGLAPENTLAAFRLAADLGVQSIETDLHLSRDGRLVIFHDSTLARTTDGRGRLSGKSLDELKRLDAGSWFRRREPGKRAARPFAGERIPTVEEVLDFARQRDIRLYLEMKAPSGSGAEEAVVAAIRGAGALNRCHVICFDLDVLARVRQIEPAIPLGYLFSKRMRNAVSRAVDAAVDTLLPRANRVTAKLIAEAKRHDLKVVTWTVNEPKQMKKLITLGIDGIMTNYPDRLAALLGPNRAQG